MRDKADVEKEVNAIISPLVKAKMMTVTINTEGSLEEEKKVIDLRDLPNLLQTFFDEVWKRRY